MYLSNPAQDFHITSFPSDTTNGPILEVKHANTSTAVTLLDKVLSHDEARIERWDGVSLTVTCGQRLITLNGEVRNELPRGREDAVITYVFRRVTSCYVPEFVNRFITFSAIYPERCSDTIKEFLILYAEATTDASGAPQR